VQEAIAQETDQTVDRLTTELRSKNIRYDEVRRVDGTHIVVRNIPSDQVAQFRDIAHQQQYEGIWELSPAPGEPNAFLLTLRPSAISAIQETTMNSSLETIERRINALGLTEPTIQCAPGSPSREVDENFVVLAAAATEWWVPSGPGR